MTNHEPAEDLFEEMLREAVEAHLATEENRDDIHDTFNSLVDAAIGSGHVTVTGAELKRITRDHHWVRLNTRAGRATQTYLKQLVSGALYLFEVDQALDVIVTAGESRRTLIRHINRMDIDRMTDARKGNYEKQAAAWADWRDGIAPTLTSWVDQYGSIPAALKAGAVPVRAAS